MGCEMESMGSNSVWSLVEAHRRVKPIGSMLIYKKEKKRKKALVSHEWTLMCKSRKGQWTVRWNLCIQTQYGLL